MCCSLETFKRVIPFAITLTVGLFVASLFYSFTSPVTKSEKQFNRIHKVRKEKRSYCNMDKQINSDEIIFLDVDSSVEAETETRIIRPTLTETIIINEETVKTDQ